MMLDDELAEVARGAGDGNHGDGLVLSGSSVCRVDPGEGVGPAGGRGRQQRP